MSKTPKIKAEAQVDGSVICRFDDYRINLHWAKFSASGEILQKGEGICEPTADELAIFAQAADEKHIQIAAVESKKSEVKGQRIMIGGNTYKHRDTLKRMGFTWWAQGRAWTGTADLLVGCSLPSGCYEVTMSDVLGREMSRADSDM